MLNRQGGMSLLEILAAIAVGTVLFIGLTDMIDVSLEDARGQQAAYHQSQVVAAAQKYITANFATLKTNTAGGAVVSATVTDLVDFLPAGFGDQNSYRQNTCVLIRQGSTPEKLDALVVSYGGVPIPDKNIASVAMNAGQGAGYIPSAAMGDTGVARGPSWSLNTTPYRPGTCSGGSNPLTGGASDGGHLVSNIFYDGPGNVLTDFLYRDAVPGQPELNSMNVPLQMANAGLVAVGAPCTQNALALESTSKDVVVCDGGTWRYSSSSWKPPVANWIALTTTPGNDGDVRVARDTGRAFVRTGGVWSAMGIDENGDLNVPRDIVASRDLSARDVRASRNVTATQDMIATRDIAASRDLRVTRNIDVDGNADFARNVIVGQTLTAMGNIDGRGNMDLNGYFRGKGEVRGDWMATNMIVIDGRHVSGEPCHVAVPEGIQNPRGTVMIDSLTGLLINCAADNRFRFADQH